MTDLSRRKCVPCEGGIAPLERADAERYCGSLHQDWQLADDAKSIRREFAFRDFFRTMSFVNALAHIANLEDHHPDLEVGYNRCRVSFTTHAIKGLSENDFICAAKIDLIPLA
ncbi:MAG TPA: 4a-hydroxytetrahydrobiopterin dehydratase [Steroidobacteraceae bacterium]|nr:4a-hydroxytetrahydrobiopterin dehydratase [Steroidobacteraceae bacterium]